MDKRVLDGYLAQGASVVLEGLDVLDPAINAFVAELDAGFPLAFANCVAFFSQLGNEAYRGHFDSDYVLAIHLSGEKHWRLFARQESRRVNTNDLTPEQMGPQIGELTMRPGDVLYVRYGRAARLRDACRPQPASRVRSLRPHADGRVPAADGARALRARDERAVHAGARGRGRVRRPAALAGFHAELGRRADALRAELRAFRERIGFAGRVTALSRFARR